MSKEELLTKLRTDCANEDVECGHQMADGLLLEFINDPEIEAAFNALHKWYA